MFPYRMSAGGCYYPCSVSTTATPYAYSISTTAAPYPPLLPLIYSHHCCPLYLFYVHYCYPWSISTTAAPDLYPTLLPPILFNSQLPDTCPPLETFQLQKMTNTSYFMLYLFFAFCFFLNWFVVFVGIGSHSHGVCRGMDYKILPYHNVLLYDIIYGIAYYCIILNIIIYHTRMCNIIYYYMILHITIWYYTLLYGIT